VPNLRFIRRIADFIVHAALVIIALLVIGFIMYAQSATRARPLKSDLHADGIVALTGDGGGRIEEGLKQLQEGRGERLLISGANPQATDRDLAIAYKVPQSLFNCCVDVGRNAEDTIGNAKETAEWARKNGYKRLIIVTADFHMARSLTEIRMELPEATLIAHPVRTLSGTKSWWSDSRTMRRLSVEYVKVVAAKCRAFLAWINPFDGKG
jgi:uncharacterized SAM-binding protein YcdF (DUF218 family)